MLRTSSVFTGALVFFATHSLFAQTDVERATARKAANAGRQAYEAGNYEQAIDSLKRAEQLLHAPTHLLYLARSQAKLGKLVEARENYLKIANETLAANAPKPFVEAQAAAWPEREAVESRLSSVVISLQGSTTTGVIVEMDGAKLPFAVIGIRLPVDPGEHVFKASARSAQSNPVTITLTEGAKQNVLLTLAPAPAPESPSSVVMNPNPNDNQVTVDSTTSHSNKLRVVSYVSFGVGAVGLGLGTFLVLKSHSNRQSAEQLFDACNKNPAMSDVHGKCNDPQQVALIQGKDGDADRQRNLGVASLVVGGVGVAAGVTLLILDAKQRNSAQSTEPHVTPVIGLGSLGLVGTF